MADRWWEADKPIAPAGSAKSQWWENDAPVVQPVAAQSQPQPVSGPLAATGQVHDGDTFRLNTGANGRLYGVDAFELGQTARTRAGATVPVGQQARDLLARIAVPQALVKATGAQTYGRPVITLDNGGDAGTALLDKGMAIAAPEYLKADPDRLLRYLETERIARLNRRGAWQTSFEQPASYRHGTPDPWNPAAEGKQGDQREAVFWDDPLPAQGLRPEIAKGYLGIWQDPASKPDDLLAYAKANGFSINPDEVRRNYAERDKGRPAGSTLTYNSLPRVLTDKGDGAVGASGRGFADPFNVLDETGALVDTLVPGSGRENLWNSDRRFGDVYANNLDQNRSILAADDANHPYARFSGQLASGLVVPGASVEGVGFGAARAALRSGASRFAAEQAARSAVVRRLGIAGAAEGAAAGAGQGEDWQGRASGGLIGGVAGAGLGTLTGYAAPKIAALVGRPFNKMAGAEGERAAGDFTDGAIDAARARASNDISGLSPRTPDALALDSQNVPRRLDRLAIPPVSARAPSPITPSPIVTAAPVRAPLPPRSLTDVAPEVSRWAAERGAGISSDGGGLPPVMLHGSPRPDIDAFDPYGRSGYGLFGTGTYLTDNAGVAAEYTTKGLNRIKNGADQTVYAVRQAVKNPLDMDAPADRVKWNAAAKVVLGEPDFFDDLPEGVTNERLWREVEDHLMGEQVYASDGQETMDALVRTLGHDGITHIGGGRVDKDGTRHRVVIALDPEQTEIVDRLTLGGMLNPQRRNLDWIDVGAREASGGHTVEPLQPYALPRAQAMDNGTPRPSITGPRVADRIDVARRPTTLLDPASADLRRAQAADLRPTDVLPVPSNTVASMDEAERIAAGRMAPVRAPDEAEALARRNVPNFNTGTSIPKRGPLDMVTWLRAHGGIRAQGGELDHLGIDNGPRKGVDFAGGENRFGPLVSNEGMTYDDAAHAAWEAGFFPDLPERPTVREFLDRLADTHSGRDRAFHPDDLGEVEDFNRLRDERYAIESEVQERGPLVRDRSEPAGYEDLDRNSPPVEAYEEWGENAPDFAGNLRLSKLDSPQEIRRALVHTERRVGGFDAATRGRITQAETKNLAADLGMTADDLLKRRKGAAFNAEEALASRQILARSATDLVNMARRMQRVDVPGEEMEAAFKQAWLRHVAIQEQVAGATAEAGRALAAFRIAADARAVDRVLPTLGDIAGGTGRLKDFADKIVDLEKSGVGPGGVNQFAAKALKPRFRDKLVELYYNSLLSNPATHAVNVLGNTITAAGQLPEHAIAASLGLARNVVRRQEAERVLFGEVGSRAVGLLQGTYDGLRQAGRTFMTGDAADAVTKVEQQTQRAISGVKGSVLRTPTRALAAEDELFKAMARRMELAGLATRQAGTEGLTGKAARARASELLANPSDEMLARSFEYGRYLTFQTPLGPVGRKIGSIAEDWPLLKLVIPFVRTPTNILKFAIERSPAAPVLKEWRRDIAAGGPKRDLAVAKVMVGSGLSATMLQLAVDGKVTGGGPADDGARRILLANGWQPYSFKIGGKYYSYSRLDPYSTILGTAADIVDLQSHMTDKQQEKSLTLIFAAIASNLSSKTWLSGLSSAIDAINDPDRHAQGFISRTAAGIATPAIVAQVARITDPIMREARDPISRIQSRIPGLSQSLPARRDVFGRPMSSGGGLGPDIVSPIYTSTDRNDPTAKALLAAGIGLTMPSRRIGGAKGRDLTPAEYDRYQEQAGAILKPQLDALVASSAWKALGSEDQEEQVRSLVRDARKDARTRLSLSPATASARRSLGRSQSVERMIATAPRREEAWVPPATDRVVGR